MDALIRFLLYISIGSALLSVNLLFGNIFYKAFFSRHAVITSFKIVGKEDEKGKLGSELAIRLQTQLTKIQQELQNSQSSLIKKESIVKTLDSSTWIIQPITPQLEEKVGIPTKILKTASLPTKIWDPLNINVTVGGVEWGQFLPRLQRWMVKERTLNVTVYYEGNKAEVVGNFGTFEQSNSELFWLQDIEPNNYDEIVNPIAHSLIQKNLSKDQSSKIGELNLTEFRDLLDIINDAASYNRNVEDKISQKNEFARLLLKIKPFVTEKKTKDWYILINLTASIAESAENYDEALFFYKQLEDAKSKREKDLKWLDSASLTSKINDLTSKVAPEETEEFKKIREDAAYAVDLLNKMFDLSLEVPPIELLDKSFKNAFWDGNEYNAPPQIQHIPDITYHTIARPFIAAKVNLTYQGQSGALYESYSDIFASLIKQKRLGQTAETADWTIGAGSIAWLKGEDVSISEDKSPLRSLKSPGTAYQNDPLLGSDSQVAHIDDLYTGYADNGGVHINSGIPNKAFYETAIAIGSERAGQIWYEALSKLSPTSDFQQAAEATYQVAGELYGNDSEEHKAVQAAWEVVGIFPKSNLSPS